MSDAYAERENRAGELGWTHVSDHYCPRKLAGKRCRNHHEYGTCWCTRLVGTFGSLNDHAATWRDFHGTRFVLWEPYGADGEHLAELVATARRDGLRVQITSSVWNPPHTIGIAFIEHGEDGGP